MRGQEKRLVGQLLAVGKRLEVEIDAGALFGDKHGHEQRHGRELIQWNEREAFSGAESSLLLCQLLVEMQG